MISQTPLLLLLLALLDELPLAPPAVRRGRPCQYSERLFLKARVVMVVRHLSTVHALVAVLDQPAIAAVRAALCEHGQLPTRHTFEWRLKALPRSLPDQIALLGEHLMALLDPWAEGGRAAAIDSTVLPARGGVWHKQHREAGVVSHTSIDTKAHWTKSSWHGWVYSWKLQLVVTVGDVWLPLAATLTPGNRADNAEAPTLLDAVQQEDVFLLGDMTYNDPALYAHCAQHSRTLITTQRGTYPHTDDGVEVRRLFHQLRSRDIENFNGQFKAIFDCSRSVPTKGLFATQRFVLGAVRVYQLVVWRRFRSGGSLRADLKPLLQAA